MDEQAKIILYKQLMRFEVMSKIKSEKLLTWEEFNEKSNSETLKYTLEYRDKCSEVFNKRAPKSERRELYLELPEMNLEGEDLSKLYIHDFMPGYARERNNGKKVFITTKINLKDTNCIINMATIRPIIISDDGKTIRDITADISKCNFRGCIVFGKFQNSKARLEYTAANLPREYIDRLIEFRVPDDAILTTDNVYLDMLEGKIVRGTNGLDKVKQMVDYDMTKLSDGIWRYRTVIHDYKIDISYTGVFIQQFGIDSIGKENYFIDLEGRAKDAYKMGDMEYVENVFKEIDKETKKSLVGLALKDGKDKFVKKHKKELKTIQKKYLDAKQNQSPVLLKVQKEAKDLIEEYKEGKFIELELDMANADVRTKNEVIKEIYNEGNMKVVQKYLNSISPKYKNEILKDEYDKGNTEFVHKNFGKIDNQDLKHTILKIAFEEKDFEFLYKNYRYIYNNELKDKILENAYNEGNVDFLNENINDLSRERKIDAAIKFKEINISKEELEALLRE